MLIMPPAAVERRTADRYRVTVHMNGVAEAYRPFRSNQDATEYQLMMRNACRLAGLPVFVHKERISHVR